MTRHRQSHKFKGYAIVSADGFIADATGRMPEALKFDADWDYFQAALNRADVTLLGRITHEAAPNRNKRRRLVFSRHVKGMVEEDGATFWINPDETDAYAAITEISGPASDVAVAGGRGIYDWAFSNPGFSAFHLSVAHQVRLKRGQTVLKDAHDLKAIRKQLEEGGLTLSDRDWLDRAADLELFVYRRS